jgi:hypothetical protein
VRRRLILPLLILSLAPWARAEKSDAGYLPPSHGLFKPLLADPRELQYAVRAIWPVGHRSMGEAAIGDYLGVYRWNLPNDAAFQISAGGGVFGRFDLSSQSNSLQVADYYANLPFDYQRGPLGLRFMIYHTSSHLGDDYLKAHGGEAEKHTWDNLKWLASYDLSQRWRGYGGYTYVFRTLPSGGRNALQAGFEGNSKLFLDDHAQLYWANDFQSWERVGWNPMFASQAGVKFLRDPATPRWISVFLEFLTGRQPHGQFYLESETRWSLGVRFELS